MKTHKLLWRVISIMILSFVICGCANDTEAQVKKGLEDRIDGNAAIYPVYCALNAEEKKLYQDICAAIENHETSVHIGEFNSKEESDEAVKWIKNIYRQLIYEQPDYFWVSPYEYTVNEVKDGKKYNLSLLFSYNMDEDTARIKEQEYQKKVNEIVEHAKAENGIFNKVLYVHDYILENCRYDYELAKKDKADLGVSAYGCLIEGSTICSGYTLAFTSIMQKLGIEVGSEFNNYAQFSIIEGHVWNYCKLDGEYYYFDLTWDDTIFDNENYRPYIKYSHMYFGITKDELSKSNFTLAEEAPTPDCNGTKFNYFVYKNQSFHSYNFEAVKASILNQTNEKFIALRFDNYGELLKAERELLTEGQINTILPEKENIRYVISNPSLHLYIFFNN